TASTSRDTAVRDRQLSQGSLELSSNWPRAHVGLAVRTLDEARPWQLEGSAGWSPLPQLTLWGDVRSARYSLGRTGDRACLGPGPRTRYFTTHGLVRLLPGLELAGWYFDPLVRGGTDFEPPYHARVSLTFYSRFWRVYRSGIFALRVEAAAESWSRGTAGLDSSGAPLALPGKTFGELNVEI